MQRCVNWSRQAGCTTGSRMVMAESALTKHLLIDWRWGGSDSLCRTLSMVISARIMAVGNVGFKYCCDAQPLLSNFPSITQSESLIRRNFLFVSTYQSCKIFLTSMCIFHMITLQKTELTSEYWQPIVEHKRHEGENTHA
ncbi:hypothetical protein O9993_09485 [Vibrio lentus]|nr:hypothetical protein [Vibrio lentus]